MRLKPLVIAVLCSATLAGCSNAPQESEQPPPPPEVATEGLGTNPVPEIADSYSPLDHKVFPEVDSNDPQAVIKAGLEKAMSWKPAEDSTQYAGFERAKTAFNERWLASHQVNLAMLAPLSGRDWQLWASENVTTSAAVDFLPDQHPPDSAKEFHRVVMITLSRHRAAETPEDQDYIKLVAAVRAFKSQHGWKIESVKVIDQLPVSEV